MGELNLIISILSIPAGHCYGMGADRIFEKLNKSDQNNFNDAIKDALKLFFNSADKSNTYQWVYKKWYNDIKNSKISLNRLITRDGLLESLESYYPEYQNQKGKLEDAVNKIHPYIVEQLTNDPRATKFFASLIEKAQKQIDAKKQNERDNLDINTNQVVHKIERDLEKIAAEKTPERYLERLTQKLKESFQHEVKINPSMQFIHSEQEIFPKAKLDSLYTRVQIDSKNGFERKETISLEEALDYSWKNAIHHISLFGIGGLGKTTSLLSLKWKVPVVYIPLRNFTEEENTISKYIQITTLNSDEQMYKSFLLLCNMEWVDRPSVVLILDGINEIDSKIKNNILKDIMSNWSAKTGIQIIAVSRYDISSELYNINMHRVHLMQLTQKQIIEYLKNNYISVPSASDRIWRVIDTPLMLNLYAKIEPMKEQYGSDPDIDFIENINAGAIIWNYLQCEIFKNKQTKAEIVNIAIAAEFIAPYIAYQMQCSDSSGTFSISKKEMMQKIYEAYNIFQKHKASNTLPDHLYQIVMSMDEKETIHDETKFYQLLTKDICLFVVHKKKIQLMHQHFRDALAAIYLYQVADSASNYVPDEWKQPVDQYVGDFLSDLMQAETNIKENIWKKIWRLFKEQYSTQAMDSNEKELFIKNMLRLYKSAWGNDISEIDFSSLNLARISLCGYRLTKKSKEHFKGTIIDEGTFGRNDGHRMMICSISWSPSGSHFLSASHDCNIFIWDEKNNDCERINSKSLHSRYIRSVQWCPTDDKKIASAGDNSQLIVWTFDGECWNPNIKAECSEKSWIYSLAWTNNGNAIVYGDNVGNLYYLSTNTVDAIQYQRIHKKEIRCIACSQYNLFASGSNDGSNNSLVCVWAYEETKPLLKLHFNEPIKSVQWAGNDTILAIFTVNGASFIKIDEMIKRKVCEWNEAKGQNILWKMKDREICSAVIRTYEDWDYCAVFCQNAVEIFKGRLNDHQYQQYSIASREFDARELGIISCAEWNSDCSRLVFGSRNGSLWHAKVLKEEGVFERILIDCIRESKSNSARCSAWNFQGTHLAAGYDDGMLRIWDVLSKRCTHVFEGHVDSIKCVAWESVDSKDLLATGSDDGNIIIWDYKKTEALALKKFFSTPINCIVWLDDKKLIGGTDNQALIIWDIIEDKFKRLDNEHTGKIYSVLIAKEKNYAISAGNDKILCVWRLSDDLEKIECVQKIDSKHHGSIRGLAWAPGEIGVFSGANDRELIYRAFDSANGLLAEEYTVLPCKHEDYIYSVTASGNEKFIITGSTDYTVGFWDSYEKQFITHGKEHSDYVWNVSASPEIHQKYYVVSTSSDGTIKIWDTTNIALNSDSNLSIKAICSLEVLPGIHIEGCDFKGAIIKDNELRRLIQMNGGIVY